MRELNFEQMEVLEGGIKITSSMLVCGGLGIAYGFIPVIGIATGAGVAFVCNALWDDIEGYDPVLWEG